MRLFIVLQEDGGDSSYPGDAILLSVEHRVKLQTVDDCKEHDKPQSFLYSWLTIASEKQRWKAGMIRLLKVTSSFNYLKCEYNKKEKNKQSVS